MKENWEDAILQSFEFNGGQATLQQIYKTIPYFVGLTDDHTRETQWGGRPAYQHAIRSYVSNRSEAGALLRIGRGKYRLTDKGINRLRKIILPSK